MVVARGEGVEVAETVEGDGILRGRVADGRSVAGDATLGDIVGSLRTGEEAITANDSVRSEGRAL
jgi:hypothetical protein